MQYFKISLPVSIHDYKKLQKAAASQGKTIDEYIRDTISQYTQEQEAKRNAPRQEGGTHEA